MQQDAEQSDEYAEVLERTPAFPAEIEGEIADTAEPAGSRGEAPTTGAPSEQ